MRLTQLQIARPKITLDAMKSGARLSVIDNTQDKIVRDEKLLQINYQAGQTYILRAHESAMTAEHWRVDTAPDERSAYTLYLGDMTSGMGTIKLRGAPRFEVSVTALAPAMRSITSVSSTQRRSSGQETTQSTKGGGAPQVDQSSKTGRGAKGETSNQVGEGDKGDKGDNLPSSQRLLAQAPERVKLTKIHTVKLPAGSAVITFYDTREQQEYRFISPVIAKSTLTWRIRKNRQSVNPKRPWRVEATIR